MTRDAFCKAEEIKKKIDAAHQLYNIVSNSTLSSNEDEFEAHNEHVRKDNMILCCMHKGDSLFGKEREMLDSLVRYLTLMVVQFQANITWQVTSSLEEIFQLTLPKDLRLRSVFTRMNLRRNLQTYQVIT